jgi:hypothetical protein
MLSHRLLLMLPPHPPPPHIRTHHVRCTPGLQLLLLLLLKYGTENVTQGAVANLCH